MRKKNPNQFTLPLERGVDSNWHPLRVSELPSWAAAKVVGFDVETKDTLLKTHGPGSVRAKSENYIIGFSFCLDKDFKTYVPLRHAEDNVEDINQALSYLREQMRNFTGELVGTNIQYDLGYLLQEGVDWNPLVKIRDVQIAEPLICELKGPGRMSNALGALGKRYGCGAKDDAMLNRVASLMGVDAKGEMYKIPARFVGAYAEQDVLLPLQIIEQQRVILTKNGLDKIFDIESKVTPILAKMRHKGVKVDITKVNAFSEWAESELALQLAIIKHETGIDLSAPKGGDDKEHPLNSTKKLQPIIENNIGISCTNLGRVLYPKIEMTVSTHPVAVALERARKMMKVENGFVGSTRELMVNGRVHPTFNQLQLPREWEKNKIDYEDVTEGGAAYGRLSCDTPNLQNQPARDDFAAKWRDVYESEDGEEWVSADYSQQEPRLFAEIAERMAIKKWSKSDDPQAQKAAAVAIKAADYYRNDPQADNHQLFAKLTGLKRKEAKPVYLGVIYGMGGGKLSTSLGLEQAFQVSFWDSDEKVVKYFPLEQQREAEKYRLEVLQDNGWMGKQYKVWCGVAAGKEADTLLTRFHDNAPHIKMAKKTLEDFINRNGFIPTILNRRCHFEMKKDGKGYDWLHKALNRVIQGSAGDQSKQALINLDEAGLRPLLQVHDEFCLSLKNRKDALTVSQIMRDAIPGLNVPFRVDIEIGPSWGSAKPWNGE
jgi:DNA polymerase I-like protein with 3'-5' exonuclease and polymerase domains